MKKKRSLIISSWVTGLILLIAIIILIIFYGNPFGYYKSKTRISNYKELMDDIDFNLFNESKIYYNFKNGTYVRNYTYKTQGLLYFSIECDNVCSDDYNFNFIEGTNALQILGNNINNKYFNDYDENYGVLLLEPITTLDKLDSEYSNKFLNNIEVESLPIFKATFTITVDSFESDEIYNSFVEINNYMASKNYNPVYMEASVFLEDGETNITISNVTSDMLISKEAFENIY